MLDLSVAGTIALKTALLLAIAGVAAWALAGKSAALRHALWTGALLFSLLMPIAVLTLPSLTLTAPSWLQPELVASAGSGSASSVAKFWLAGAFIVLLHQIVAHCGLIRWMRRARPLRPGAWAATLSRVAGQWRIRDSLRVLEAPAVVNTCTWGFLRPVLLLPQDGDTWTEAERRHVLMHELAHVRRCDYLTSNLVRLACAMHWYNPLVWLAARQSRKLQEQACDDMVLQAGAMPSDYAGFLVHVAGNAKGETRRLAAAMGIVRHGELHERVRAILDPEKPRAPLSGASVFSVSLPAACLALFLASAIPGSPVSMLEMRQDLAVQPAAPLAQGEATVSPPDLRHGERPPVPRVPPVPPVPPVPAVPPVPPVPETPPDEQRP